MLGYVNLPKKEQLKPSVKVVTINNKCLHIYYLLLLLNADKI